MSLPIALPMSGHRRPWPWRPHRLRNSHDRAQRRPCSKLGFLKSPPETSLRAFQSWKFQLHVMHLGTLLIFLLSWRKCVVTASHCAGGSWGWCNWFCGPLAISMFFWGVLNWGRYRVGSLQETFHELPNTTTFRSCWICGPRSFDAWCWRMSGWHRNCARHARNN